MLTKSGKNEEKVAIFKKLLPHTHVINVCKIKVCFSIVLLCNKESLPKSGKNVEKVAILNKLISQICFKEC